MGKPLQELLLRRKELAEKLSILKTIKPAILTETKTQRVDAREGFSDLIVTVPRVTMSDFTSEYDFYASQLRQIDSKIQNANWTHIVDNVESLFEAWPRNELPKVEVEKKPK